MLIAAYYAEHLVLKIFEYMFPMLEKRVYFSLAVAARIRASAGVFIRLLECIS